jgi:large subunit ribosomal protein L1
VLDAVGKAKPATFKGGVFIKSVTISSSMSPGVRVASSEFSKY